MSKDTLKTILFSIMIISGTAAYGIGLGMTSIYFKCINYSEVTGLETKVVVPYCFVKIDDAWFSLDELRHSR